jgi:phosphatidylserine decarboxylase
VMLFPKNVVTFNSDWAPSKSVRLGEAMAAASRDGSTDAR